MSRLPYSKRLGKAFAQFLEAIDPTDLDNAVLLGSHHHHRIHETGYRTDRLPNGDTRFHRRR